MFNHMLSKCIDAFFFVTYPGWRALSNMTIMLRHGVIIVIPTRHAMIMTTSWNGSHVFPTRDIAYLNYPLTEKRRPCEIKASNLNWNAG